jgi:hypothetical protein
VSALQFSAGDLMEAIMKKNLRICIVVFVVVVPALHAAEPGHPNPNVQGTVVHVQQHKVYSPDSMIGGSNPSDAPLTSRYYAYEVSVRVNCETYVGRYETPFNYLPSEFTSSQPIQVRLTKHVLYFDLPNNPDLRMGIVRRKEGCGANR